MAKEASETSLLDEELVIQVRQYIALRKELIERGEILAKCLESRPKTVVIVNGDEAFEVGKSYSGELPLSTRPADVLGAAS